MSMISAIDVGERTRGGLAVYDVNRSSVNSGAVYQSLLNRRPMQGQNILNPGAIRAEAAKAVNEEKKIALDERRVAVMEATEQRAAVEQTERRRMDEQQKQFERSQAIDTEYEKKMTGAQERYAKDTKTNQEMEQFKRGKDLQARKDAFPQFMEGVYQRNPDPVKNYLNEFGSKKANVAKVEFATPEIDPENPESIKITYEGGGTSFFKDPKEFYQTFAAFVDPNFEEAIYTRRLKEAEEGRKTAKASREEAEFQGTAPLTEKEKKDMRAKGLEYLRKDPDYFDQTTGKQVKGADLEKGLKEYEKLVIGDRQAPQGRASTAGFKESKASDGRVRRDYDDGAVEILKDGKVIAAKDKNGNVINAGNAETKGKPPKGPASTVDYGTGEMTPEGEAALDAIRQNEAKTKAEGERKAAIKEKEAQPREEGHIDYEKNGVQMRKTVYSDRTTKTEKIESKDGGGDGDGGGDKKKKKKKKDGGGDGGDGGNGGE